MVFVSFGGHAIDPVARNQSNYAQVLHIFIFSLSEARWRGLCMCSVASMIFRGAKLRTSRALFPALGVPMHHVSAMATLRAVPSYAPLMLVTDDNHLDDKETIL